MAIMPSKTSKGKDLNKFNEFSIYEGKEGVRVLNSNTDRWTDR